MKTATWYGRWQSFPDVVARWVPDAITAAVLLTFAMVTIALLLGNPIVRILDGYHQGLWMMLQFTMQMSLIIVLSAALAVTPFLRRAIAALARVPRTARQMVALAFLSAGLTSYVYWGLGYALGPMIAIFFAAEAERRRIPVDFPFLLGTTYGAQALWQYGLSSSGPLLVAGKGHFLQDVIGVLPLSTTIWSPAAILHELTYAAAAITAACWLIPKRCRWLSQFPEAAALAKDSNPEPVSTGPVLSMVQRLENSPLVTGAVAVMIAGWLVDHFFIKRLGHEINSLNATLLMLTFLLYGSVKKFSR